MLTLLDAQAQGTYNATSPAGQWTLGDLIDVAVAVGGAAAPRPAWTDEALLLEHKVEPWTGLPFWIPESAEDMGGFMAFDCTRASRAGLATRPLAQIVADTAVWLAARDDADAWKNVLTAQGEAEILAERAATDGVR